MQISTAFTDDFGPDADATIIIGPVTPQSVSLQYWSTRGITVRRNVLVSDQDNANTFVGMP
jgi:hypothetical protein